MKLTPTEIHALSNRLTTLARNGCSPDHVEVTIDGDIKLVYHRDLPG